MLVKRPSMSKYIRAHYLFTSLWISPTSSEARRWGGSGNRRLLQKQKQLGSRLQPV
jgi:hypothetical protein